MPDESKRELARERTDFAEDRTVLANERTFAGWLRTGYAGIGIGLAFNALFGRVEPGWIAKLIASVFLLIAIMVFAGAERRSAAVADRLNAHKVQSEKVNNADYQRGQHCRHSRADRRHLAAQIRTAVS